MALDRRSLLRFGALGLGAATAGCDQVGQSAPGADALSFGNWLTYKIQRLIIPPGQLAAEFPKSAISASFRANGTIDPPDPDYHALAKNKFVDWRFKVGGLVKKPLSLSLADIRALPVRTQITRHNCVEGWSCIGEWAGAQLSHVLDEAGVQSEARFAVFYCADSMDADSIVSTNEPDSGNSDATQSQGDGQTNDPSGDANADASAGSGSEDSANADGADSSDDDALPDTHYYSSIDLVDARHPQTILAYEMNGAPLTIPYGAPMRLRVERQLGYKMPKYLMRMELVRDFSDIRGGKGGYWEDLGYDWFAGV
jgi:DMSO/TMAO reductase YedYZ molybdopterin-dependent catalytic subunit